MKILDKILKYSAAALFFLLLWGCQEDESLIKPTALLVDPELIFEAQGNDPQLLMIASDDYWRIDVAEEWITVDPMEGNNTMKVTVTVNDNVTDGVVGAPRTATISVANLNGYVVTAQINQKGDNYLGVSEMTLSSARSLEDGKFAKIPEAQVVALAAEGFIVSDETDLMFIKSDAAVSIGDNVFLAGEKKTIYSSPVLEAGEVTIKSSGEVTYPNAVDFVSSLDPSNASKITYVSLEAGILGRTLYFEESLPVSVTVLDPRSGDIDLEAVNMHNITAKAYFLALDGADVKLVLTEVEDKGINDELNAYFYDDFSWMKALIDASGVKVDDSIADNNASGSAPNLRTNADLEDLLDEFLARGYEDLNSSAKVIYPQRCYWKFSKSNDGKLNNGGIKLPAIDFEGDQLINVDMTFNWAAHMTGSGNIDKVSVVVELEGEGFFENGTNVSDPFVTTQQKGNLQWQDASLMVKGVNRTTRFTVRPKDYDKTDPNQQRWYIDNIKISASDIPYSDPVYANVTVSEEVVTFAGTPTAPVAITIKSDNDWTLTKDTESTWFSFDVTEGIAGEESTVTITCEPSTSTDLRKGYITLTSADTRKNIYVVQSAAGGELAPFVSLVDGNSMQVDGMTGEFEVAVQANVGYTVTSDVEWLALAPSTKAIVEVTTVALTKKANLTGEPRVGHVVFANAEHNVETVLTVTQAVFTPEVTAAPVHKTTFVSGYGCTINYSINANVPYAVTTDSDWVKLPASQGPAGNITIPIQFLANNTDAVRTATVTFHNPEYDYTAVHTINQYPSGIVFQEDFSWMAPMIAAYNATVKTPIGDTVGTNGSKGESPNAYTKAEWLATDFWTVFNAMGYENTNPSAKVLYPQDAYLKFGKTGDHSGLFLPSIAPEGDVTLTFNWCAQVQGSGVVDPVKMLVELQGDGVCADTNDKISTPTASTQPTGTYEWQTYTVTLKGVTPATRILIRHNDMTSAKAIRFHLDNIKIVK